MPLLLDEVRRVARVRHLSIRTEQAYAQWIRRFIVFHHKRHPRDMGEAEIRQFISHLAVEGNITASTQTVALSALLFLYRDVLKQKLPYVSDIERARKPKRCQRSSREMKRNGSLPVWKGLIGSSQVCFMVQDCG